MYFLSTSDPKGKIIFYQFGLYQQNDFSEIKKYILLGINFQLKKAINNNIINKNQNKNFNFGIGSLT